MNERDPYVLLGVAPDCTDAELRKAYRRLAREFHPDHNPGDSQAAARFADIAWAYAQVDTPQAREKVRARRAPSLAEEMRNTFMPQETRVPARGADRHVSIEVSFAEAYAGTQVELEVDAHELCATCGGSGAAPGSLSRRCVVCRGQGVHRAAGLAAPCGSCQGKGMIIDDPCVECEEGMRSALRRHTLRIPAGVEDDTQMVVPRAGEPGAESPGALVVRVRVADSAVFTRMEDGGDLLMEVPVTYAEACLGAQLRVPAPDRMIVLTLPAGTASHALLRARECGMPRPDGTRGDLYIRPVIAVPPSLSGSARRLVTELRAHDDPGVRNSLLADWTHERESAPPGAASADN